MRRGCSNCSPHERSDMRGSRAKNADVCCCGTSDPACRHSASKTRVNALLAHAGYEGTVDEKPTLRCPCSLFFEAPGTPLSPFSVPRMRGWSAGRRQGTSGPPWRAMTRPAARLRQSLVTQTRRFEAREPNDVGPSASRRSTSRSRARPISAVTDGDPLCRFMNPVRCATTSFTSAMPHESNAR
jgi:hypothetical protein